MLIVHADTLLALMKGLDRLAAIYEDFADLAAKIDQLTESPPSTPDPAQAEEVENIKMSLETGCNRRCDDLKSLLDDVASHCVSLQLRCGLAQIKRIQDRLVEGTKFRDLCLAAQITNLSERIEDDFRDRMFLFVALEKAALFKDDPVPFGTKVKERFPNVSADIEDARWCLGIERSTAAVYHLMRVVEFGIRRLAKRLRLPTHLEHKPWGDILKAARTATAALPYTSTKERNRRDRCSEAIAHLNTVKDAWRNPTMHAKRRYSPEEAEAIYASVKTFMNYLADNL